jgi:nicotinate-nucleotide pyrophosphorylase (carboxylating)
VSTRKIHYPQIALDSNWIDEQVARFIKEDRAGEDITTAAIIPQDILAMARLEAEQDLIFAGSELIPPFFDSLCEVDLQVSDGQRIEPGDAIGTIGGTNHRLDLCSGILIKDNHLAVAVGVAVAIESLRKEHPDRPVEVEVETEEQVMAGVEAGADALLLDNMTAEEVRNCVKTIRDHPNGRNVFIEASGGITLESVAAYAQTGVDGISVGRLTHSAPAVDIRVELIV